MSCTTLFAKKLQFKRAAFIRKIIKSLGFIMWRFVNDFSYIFFNMIHVMSSIREINIIFHTYMRL